MTARRAAAVLSDAMKLFAFTAFWALFAFIGILLGLGA